MENADSTGVIYLATGEKYLKEAIYSCKTLKKHNKVEVTLFSDESGSEYILKHAPDKIFDFVKITRFKYKGFKAKIEILTYSPYKHTLFIDTDTEIRGNVLEPLKHLNEYDFALAGMRWLDFTKKIPLFLGYEKPLLERSDIKVLNTGVIYFRKNEKVISFLNFWLQSIKDSPNLKIGNMYCDQSTLNYLLEKSEDKNRGVSFKMIPNTIYNCRSLFFKNLKKEGKYKDIAIVHEHGLNKNFIYKLKKRMRKSASLIYRKYIKK